MIPFIKRPGQGNAEAEQDQWLPGRGAGRNAEWLPYEHWASLLGDEMSWNQIVAMAARYCECCKHH